MKRIIFYLVLELDFEFPVRQVKVNQESIKREVAGH